MRLKQLILFLFATGFHSNTSSRHTLADPLSRLTALLEKGTRVHASHAQSRPAGLSSRSPPAAQKLTRKKKNASSLLLTTGLAQRRLTYSRNDVNKCGLDGANRSDMNHKSLIAPNHRSNIMIFCYVGHCYKT